MIIELIKTLPQIILAIATLITAIAQLVKVLKSKKKK
ncbi:Uncharacterised protein [Klebsiella pneumoniae]|nr:hypothetical protein G841_04891 [Escherichia coli HVH 189 (4-3220125)]SJJ58932.1 Uncharacterised protein [Shigella sonnei]SRV24429.1 Uncharacterised protein [Shigella sonnei]SYT48870.1 Uncharacterised protein [Klebsiella pneumoniae]SYU11842.1 Uncharacterised protein [Klebsiella pneumoniae]